MTTLVACLTRGTSVADPPVVGRSAVESLVTSLGVEDPEDSRVNCILEAIRVADDLDDETVLAVLSGPREPVGGERAIARQLDELVEAYDLDSAVVVVDSAENERLVPIVESRLPVDAVDRVVVRQARDIESTYYLLKQFLADEELRKTILVPIGVALLVFPALLLVFESITHSLGAIAAVVGLFLLYKGLRLSVYLTNLSNTITNALYAGQVSLVTYVVAGGLALVGIFLGGLGASSLDVQGSGELLVLAQFVYDSIPWLTAAALIASAGRLLDEFIRNDEIGATYVNLPFVAVAVGLAIRGFAAYFLQVSGAADPLQIPDIAIGSWESEGIVVAPGTRLGLFILASIVVSLIGVRIASYVSGVDYESPVDQRSS